MTRHDHMTLELSMLLPRFFHIANFGLSATVFCTCCRASIYRGPFPATMEQAAARGQHLTDAELHDEAERLIEHKLGCLGPLALAAERARVELRYGSAESDG